MLRLGRFVPPPVQPSHTVPQRDSQASPRRTRPVCSAPAVRRLAPAQRSLDPWMQVDPSPPVHRFQRVQPPRWLVGQSRLAPPKCSQRLPHPLRHSSARCCFPALPAGHPRPPDSQACHRDRRQLVGHARTQRRRRPIPHRTPPTRRSTKPKYRTPRVYERTWTVRPRALKIDHPFLQRVAKHWKTRRRAPAVALHPS